MAYEFIIYEKDKQTHIARITFNRPEKLNVWPWRGGMTAEFHSALDDAEEDDDIKVVILKGAGRAFTAGHDLTEVGFVYGMGTGQPGERRASQRRRLRVDRVGYEQYRRLFYCPKVTIAQIHGYCIGEGMILISCCDLAVAAEDAQFAHSEQRLAFAGASVGTYPILCMMVGLRRARELTLLGRTIDGKEAERIGLINKAVPADKLEEEVDKLAEAVTLLPADAISIGKATTEITYDRLGLGSGFAHGFVGHTLATNLRFEPDEYNYFKERRDKGARTGFHGVHNRFKDKV